MTERFIEGDGTVPRAWPSGDLLRQLAANTLTELTLCPSCGCPCVVHAKQLNAFLCPPDAMENQQRYLDLAKRAGAQKDVNVRLGVRMEKARREEFDALRSTTPDLDFLAPMITSILEAQPDMTVLQAVLVARQRLSPYSEVELDRKARELRRIGLLQEAELASEQRRNALLADRARRQRVTRNRMTAAAEGRRRAWDVPEEEEDSALSSYDAEQVAEERKPEQAIVNGPRLYRFEEDE